MTIYLINIFLIMLSGSLFLYGVPERRNKKLFCTIATLQWVMLSGLRHISIGPDTYSYKIHSFDVRMYQTWGSLFENFVDVLFRGAVGKDPGYYLFEKFVQIFTTNYQIYLIIIAVIFTVPLGIWIYKNSSEPVISFLIYSTLFYSLTLTAHRQIIAISLVVFLGYEFIKKRRFFPFLFLTLIACTIHKSSIFFFPFYFLANKKITIKYLIAVLTLIPIMFIFRDKLLFPLAAFMEYEDYLAYYEGAGTWTFSTVLLLLTLVAFIRLKTMLKNNLQTTHYINALLIALLLIPLTFINPVAMRVVQYFSMFLMLLVPEIINSFQKKDRAIVYYVAVMVLLILFIKNNPQYLFCWQGI